MRLPYTLLKPFQENASPRDAPVRPHFYVISLDFLFKKIRALGSCQTKNHQITHAISAVSAW
jgi:hypothetical protein